MKKFFSKEVKIAVAVIVSLAFLLWGIEYLKGVNLFEPVNYYYSYFDRVDGLTESAPVTVKGFQVGLVREVSYDYESGRIKVKMSLDEKLQIPTGSHSAVSSDLLGTASIVLSLSDGDEYLSLGDEIEGVALPGLMDNVSNELLPSVASILPKVDSILTAVNALISNPALMSSVERIDKITANLEASTRELNTMLGQSVPAVVNNVEEITANLNVITSELTEVSAQLKDMPLASTMENLEATTGNLKVMTDKVNGTDSSIGMLLNDQGLYQHIDHTVVSLDSLFMDIKENPKRYVTIKVF